MNTPRTLFNKFLLSALSAARDAKLNNEIQAYDAERLLATDVAELSRYLTEPLRFDLPRLREQEIYITSEETTARRSRGIGYVGPMGQGVTVPATAITYHIPFDGDHTLFMTQPSTYGYDVPDALITDCELRITYVKTTETPEAMRTEFERDLNGIRTALTYLAGDFEREEKQFSMKVVAWVEKRKSALYSADALVNALGYPLRKRDAPPDTYRVPSVRRKVPLPPPVAKTRPQPEPAIDQATYEEILRIMRNMARVMELSPRAFTQIEEEDLRTHFLVQLNAQYEGGATGERFNFGGKTDILIRENGKTLFIAECKYWNGEKSLTDAIDQLLGYA